MSNSLHIQVLFIALLCYFGLNILPETGDDFQLSLLLNGGIYGAEATEDIYTVGYRNGQFLFALRNFYDGVDFYHLFLVLIPILSYLILVVTLREHLPRTWGVKWFDAFVFVMFFENIWRPNCTQTTVLGVVCSLTYFFYHKKKSWLMLLLSTFVFWYSINYRVQVGIMTFVMYMPIPLIIWFKKTHRFFLRHSFFMPMFILTLAIVDHMFFISEVSTRQSFYEQFWPISVIFDYKQLDIAQISTLGMSQNDYEMWAYFMPMGKVLPQGELIVEAVTKSRIDIFFKMLIDPVLHITDAPLISWFVHKFMIHNHMFWLSAYTSLMVYFIFGRKTLLLIALNYSVLLYVGLSMALNFKMVFRLWDPLLLIPPMVSILIAITRNFSYKARSSYWMLPHGVALFILIIHLPLKQNDKNFNLKEKVSQLSNDITYISIFMPHEQLSFAPSEMFKTKKIFFLSWMGYGPHHRKSMRSLGFDLDSLPMRLVEDEKMYISLDDKRVSILKEFYREHYQMEVDFVLKQSIEHFYPFYRIVVKGHDDI